MRFFTARSFALATLVPALLLFAVVPGCAKQGEGERCGDDTLVDNEDCADGLVCVVNSAFLNKGANRCCYPDGRVSDSRCEPAGPESAPVGGAGGGPSTADSGAPEAGAEGS